MVRPSTLIVIDVDAVTCLESVTVTEAVKVPAAEGEPLSDPLALTVTPPGSPLAVNV